MEARMDKAIDRLNTLKKTAERTMEELDVRAFEQAALVLALAAEGDDLQMIRDMHHDFKDYLRKVEKKDS